MRRRLTTDAQISIHAPRVGSDPPRKFRWFSRPYFNPRSPCGERQIHYGLPAPPCKFQSTLPVWGATVHFFDLLVSQGISIHAPRVGSDEIARIKSRFNRYFNPRSPCGERLTRLRKHSKVSAFQSTLPVWGATVRPATYFEAAADFNPRSPCGERLRLIKANSGKILFQSTLPVWGATFYSCFYSC